MLVLQRVYTEGSRGFKANIWAGESILPYAFNSKENKNQLLI